MAKTNFEHWKEGLTIEDMVNSDNEAVICCSACPASDDCNINSNCWKVFKRWAESEYIPPKAEKSKVEQLAELLGVKVGEKFNLRWRDGNLDIHNPYILLADGVLTDCDGDERESVWAGIAQGKLTIEKIPQEPEKWKPKKGEYYYYVNRHGDIISFGWDYDVMDCAHWVMGNCFPSAEAAEAAKPEIMAKFEAIRREIEG